MYTQRDKHIVVFSYTLWYVSRDTPRVVDTLWIEYAYGGRHIVASTFVTNMLR